MAYKWHAGWLVEVGGASRRSLDSPPRQSYAIATAFGRDRRKQELGMFRNCKIVAVAAGAFFIAATPSFADEFSTLPTDLMTTVTTDLNKGMAEFNPTEILTPKPIDTAPAAEPAKKVKKRHARRHSRKMAKK